MKRILFVCHGNICRSPMAEFVMKNLVEKAGRSNEFYIESAATSTEELGLMAYLSFGRNELQLNNQQKLVPTGISLKRYRDLTTSELTTQQDTLVAQDVVEQLATKDDYAPMRGVVTLENIPYSFVAKDNELYVNLDVPDYQIEKTNVMVTVKEVAIDTQGNKQWKGTLKYLRVGEGYMLKRNADSEASFFYPEYLSNSQYGGNSYAPEKPVFENTSGESMTVVATAYGTPDEPTAISFTTSDRFDADQSHLSSLLGRGWGRTSWVWALFLALILTGCSSSDADDEQPPVQPSSSSSLTPGSDARPSWAFSDNGLYELRMTVQVELGDSLAYYQSSQDLMCAMIGGEVRAVAVPQETAGVIYYPLIIFSNGDSNTVSLSYYCDKLHRIYTISNWASFNTSAAPTGDSGMYRPRFLSEK